MILKESKVGRPTLHDFMTYDRVSVSNQGNAIQALAKIILSMEYKIYKKYTTPTVRQFQKWREWLFNKKILAIGVEKHIFQFLSYGTYKNYFEI